MSNGCVGDQCVRRIEQKGQIYFLFAMASSEFRAEAVQGTEQYARRHAYSQMSRQVVEEYKKLGF